MIRAALDAISLWAIPVMLVGIPFVGLLRKVKVYDVFIEGATEGFDVAVRIIPFLVGILVAIGMFRGSGAMDLLVAALRPVATTTGFPAELVPLAVLRSLTGSGSLAFATDLIKTHGPDSVLGRMAATMYGSSETTFYVLAVYCGAIGVRRTRHAVPAALIGDVVAAVTAVAVCVDVLGFQGFQRVLRFWFWAGFQGLARNRLRRLRSRRQLGS
jgi:spore maturation protein B